MKLLDPKTATSKLKKDNDALIESSIRIRKYYTDITRKLNSIKDDYAPDKIKKLEEFEKFCKDIEIKKAKLLSDFNQIDKLVESKKEQYYAMVEKSDLLEEKIYQVAEANKKLDLREIFVKDLEKRINNLTTS